MEQHQLSITLKALPDTSLSSGQLKLYAYVSQPSINPESESSMLIGFVELYDYDPINRRAAVGIVVSNEYRHQGYGTAIIEHLTIFCQENTSLHQVYADIAATNKPSIRIFQKGGYQCCATLRDWVIRGNKFVDTLRYQRIIKP